jgi:putative acetyltransferase
MALEIRPYRADDGRETAALFHETIRYTPGANYDKAQRAAWSRSPPELGPWHSRLAEATTLVAEDENGIAGFMSLEKAGPIDLAFVRTDRIGQGIARALYLALVQTARASGLKKLTVDASFMARRFFERQDWRVLNEQQPVRRGIKMTNFRMTIELD